MSDNKEIIIEVATPATLTLGMPRYICPKHGEMEGNNVTSGIVGYEGVWCMVCMIEKLDELGVNRMTEVL